MHYIVHYPELMRDSQYTFPSLDMALFYAQEIKRKFVIYLAQTIVPGMPPQITMMGYGHDNEWTRLANTP